MTSWPIKLVSLPFTEQAIATIRRRVAELIAPPIRVGTSYRIVVTAKGKVTVR